MIRDNLVFSAKGKLQELLLKEDDLTLEKAITNVAPTSKQTNMLKSYVKTSQTQKLLRERHAALVTIEITSRQNARKYTTSRRI